MNTVLSKMTVYSTFETVSDKVCTAKTVMIKHSTLDTVMINHCPLNMIQFLVQVLNTRQQSKYYGLQVRKIYDEHLFSWWIKVAPMKLRKGYQEKYTCEEEGEEN